MESSSFSGSSKRAKAFGNIAQVAHCLVDGCSADLSLCRDYHRRHKVCEAHSKTPKVIIGGRELRFCQQCSRFHSLVEFDEGKRSCRKRLDGHNRRRRKPQPEPIPRTTGLDFSTQQGTTRLVSFTTPQMLGSSAVAYSWSGVVKPDHEMGMACNNLQLNYTDTGSSYRGANEVGTMFVDPNGAAGSSSSRCSQRMLSQVVESGGALSLLSSATPASHTIDYSGVGQYETKALDSTSVSIFHSSEMFPEGSSSTHQTLSFMWE